jgi:cytochrome c biogenesis protein CcdA
MGSAALTGRAGALFLALGLSISFALAGTILSFLLVSLNLDPELLRHIAAVFLLMVGGILAVPSLTERVTIHLSRLTSGFHVNSTAQSSLGQFGVGFLLGLLWLPCVGPTLGAAIALASMGQSFGLAFIIMLVFGISAAAILLGAGFLSNEFLRRTRPEFMANAGKVKVVLGVLLIALALMVLTGFDKTLETLALKLIPQWAISL